MVRAFGHPSDRHSLGQRPRKLRPLGFLKVQARDRNLNPPDPKILAAMADICYEAIEKAGGKERVRQMDAVLAGRRAQLGREDASASVSPALRGHAQGAMA